MKKDAFLTSPADWMWRGHGPDLRRTWPTFPAGSRWRITAGKVQWAAEDEQLQAAGQVPAVSLLLLKSY